MSKYVKKLIADELQRRLDGVEEALVVNVVGMDANKTNVLRSTLREKNIRLTVIKNSMARRATEGTALAPAFEKLKGTAAVVWGGEDVVSLAKTITKLAEDKQFAGFEPRGGVLDGDALTAEQVKQISKWPSRTEQLSILSGQMLEPGGTLSAQLIGPGGRLASQVKEKAGGEDGTGEDGTGETEGE